ncbi:MAG: NAD-dependent epimerase/dehydratase family protein [Bacteroidota bacterium]
MKYFLTGGTGFLGSHLLKMLVAEGHEVTALVRDPGRAKNIKLPGVKLAKGDITEKESMREGMKGCNALYHVAGWYKIGVKDKSPGWKINVEGTRNVLELMKELSISKGVYTSTLAVNSDTDGEIYNEDYEFTGEHISEYDRTKAEAHKIANDFISRGLPLVTVMPGLVYGPEGTSLSDKSFRLYLRKKLPVIPKKSAFCWAHVDDIARAHMLAMKKAKPGSTYIIAGPAFQITEAFKIAENITGIKAPLAIPPFMLKISYPFSWLADKIVDLPDMYSPEAMRVQAGATYLGDNSRAKKDLGYNPRPLEEGLRQTLLYEMEKM